MRVSRFLSRLLALSSSSSAARFLLLPSARSGSQWALPDLNSELRRSVVCWASTASARAQRAVPTFNREWALPTSTRAPDHSGHCQASTATSGAQWALRTLASSRSQWALPDFNRELQIAVGTAGHQPEAPITAGTQPRAPDHSGHCRASTASDH